MTESTIYLAKPDGGPNVGELAIILWMWRAGPRRQAQAEAYAAREGWTVFTFPVIRKSDANWRNHKATILATPRRLFRVKED